MDAVSFAGYGGPSPKAPRVELTWLAALLDAVRLPTPRPAPNGCSRLAYPTPRNSTAAGRPGQPTGRANTPRERHSWLTPAGGRSGEGEGKGSGSGRTKRVAVTAPRECRRRVVARVPSWRQCGEVSGWRCLRTELPRRTQSRGPPPARQGTGRQGGRVPVGPTRPPPNRTRYAPTSGRQWSVVGAGGRWPPVSAAFGVTPLSQRRLSPWRRDTQPKTRGTP